MNFKIKHEQTFSEKELLMTSLLCFMESEKELKYIILDSAITITNIPNLNKDIAQFVKGIVLMLCDKFVKDISIHKTIANIVSGNMKIIEDYATDKINEEKEAIIINLKKLGLSIEDIAKSTNVSLDFVEKALTK